MQLHPALGGSAVTHAPVGTVNAMVCVWPDASAFGPLFMADSVYVYAAPAATGSGVSVTVSTKSAAICAVVSSVTLTLFEVFGSLVAAPAVAVLVHTPAVGRTTCKVTVALARKVKLPSVQLTVPAE